MEKITFTGDAGEKIELFILETTRLAGKDYILASDVEAGDGSCFILREIAAPEGEETVYEMVEDDRELDNLLSVFGELLEDVDLTD